MWIPLLIGLLAEFFNKSTKFEHFLIKVIGGGFIGLIINLLLAVFLPSSLTQIFLVGLMPTYSAVAINFASILTLTFIIAPFVGALIGFAIVAAARYLGVIKI
jgi:hypothetical protein